MRPTPLDIGMKDVIDEVSSGNWCIGCGQRHGGEFHVLRQQGVQDTALMVLR